MGDRLFRKYHLFSCTGVLAASLYPLWMGVRVVTDMLRNGVVHQEDYPKYIIPYTPVCLAVFTGVLLMPLCMRLFRRRALAWGSAFAAGVFFISELLLEQTVVVTTDEASVALEDWQMFLCYQPPAGWGDPAAAYKQQTAVDILMGNYDPAFKLHFYVISLVLIFSILNCLYGFGQMLRTGEHKRRKALVLQSICTLCFLGLCILACFTAFWRDGSIRVSPLSAVLMGIFFLLLGITAGVYAGSFLLGKRRFVSVGIPALTAAAMTLLMDVGEMILLHGHLYRFGTGFLFDGIPGLVLAPVDLLIIAASGGVTAWIFMRLQKNIGQAKAAGKSCES